MADPLAALSGSEKAIMKGVLRGGCTAPRAGFAGLIEHPVSLYSMPSHLAFYMQSSQ